MNVSLEAGKTSTATLEVFNVGETEAQIISFGIDIFYRRVGETSPDYDGRPEAFSHQVPPGLMMRTEVVGRSVLDAEMIGGVYTMGGRLCMVVVINYKDGDGITRTLSAFRIYDIRKKRFFRPADDDPMGEIDMTY